MFSCNKFKWLKITNVLNLMSQVCTVLCNSIVFTNFLLIFLGTYQELLDNKGEFFDLIQELQLKETTEENKDNKPSLKKKDMPDEKSSVTITSPLIKSETKAKEDQDEKSKLIGAEEAAYGTCLFFCPLFSFSKKGSCLPK